MNHVENTLGLPDFLFYRDQNNQWAYNYNKQ